PKYQFTMKSRKSDRRYALLFEDIESWKRIDPIVFSGVDQECKAQLYRKREEAITLYAQQHSLDEIFERTGIGRQELYRLRDRCLKVHPDGNIAGFRGLVPYVRLGSNTTKDRKK